MPLVPLQLVSKWIVLLSQLRQSLVRVINRFVSVVGVKVALEKAVLLVSPLLVS